MKVCVFVVWVCLFCVCMRVHFDQLSHFCSFIHSVLINVFQLSAGSQRLQLCVCFEGASKSVVKRHWVQKPILLCMDFLVLWVKLSAWFIQWQPGQRLPVSNATCYWQVERENIFHQRHQCISLFGLFQWHVVWESVSNRSEHSTLWNWLCEVILRAAFILTLSRFELISEKSLVKKKHNRTAESLWELRCCLKSQKVSKTL